MKRKMYAAFIASLGVTLSLASSQAIGGSHGWGPFGGLNIGPNGGLNVGPYDGLNVDVYRSRFTCTYDIPWDWVHRCPPIASPPAAPPSLIVRTPACLPQTVTVPGTDGKDQTITMVRC